MIVCSGLPDIMTHEQTQTLQHISQFMPINMFS